MCKLWTDREITLLKENYSKMDINELTKLFCDRTKKSIRSKALKLKLEKFKIECKEGFQICKKCGRELPWNELYYPKVRKEKNPRRVCRECNPKYDGFLQDYTPKLYWDKEDEELFLARYPHYTNEELIENFYPNLTNKQMMDKAWRNNTGKTEETRIRANKQKSPKLSEKLKGRVISEETKIKLSKTKKKMYAEGILVSHWVGRVVSDEEKKRTSERNKGKWKGDKNPRHINPLFGDNNGRWKGGVTNISTALRENIYDWKQASMSNCRYKCVLTGGEFDNIHHIIPFNNMVDECINELNLKEFDNLGEYNDNDRNKLICLLREKHSKYGLGVCLNKDVHKLFHDQYGYTGFNREDFIDFATKYFNGEYDHCLELKLKSLNSKSSLEEAIRLASFIMQLNKER